MNNTLQKEHTAFEGAMRWVGDLDHPFYDDERQRHVWYESAMIGFQLLVIVQLIVCGVVMIVVGEDSFKYWAIGIGPVFVATIAAAGYASSKGAPYTPGMSDLKRSRGVFGIGLILLYLVGVFRMNGFNFADVGDSPSTVAGFVVGLLVAGLFGFGVMRFMSRSSKTDDDDDFDPAID